MMLVALALASLTAVSTAFLGTFVAFEVADALARRWRGRRGTSAGNDTGGRT